MKDEQAVGGASTALAVDVQPPGLTLLSSMHRRSRAFDAFGAPAAILDAGATITAVNDAWRSMAESSADTVPYLGVGADYAASCRGSQGWADLGAGLAAVLSGRRRLFEAERHWPNALQDQWVLVRVIAAPVVDGLGAVVVHLDVTARRLLEARLSAMPGIDAETGLVDGWQPPTGDGAAPSRPVVLTVVDLAGLDHVRTAIGDPAARQVLVQAVSRTARAVRAGDEVLRMGRRHLVVVADPGGDTGAMAERLRAAFAEPFQVGSDQIRLGSVVHAQAQRDAAPRAAALAALRSAIRQGVRSAAPSTTIEGPGLAVSGTGAPFARPSAALTIEEVVRARAGTLDAIGEAVLALDASGRTIHLNAAAERLYGWTSTEAHGRHLSEVGPSSQTAEEVDAVLARVWSGGTWSGDVQISARDGRTFGAQVTASPLFVAGEVSAVVMSTVDVSSRLAAEAELSRRASHDPLTGLGNRAWFGEVVRDELLAGPVTVVILDLEDLQKQNRALGLPVGDHLLRSCAHTLLASTHDGDHVARLSGGSFAVCCPHERGADDPRAFADLLRVAVARPVTYAGGDIVLRSVAGAATTAGSAGTELDAAELLRRADTALLHARVEKRPSLVHDADMDLRLDRQAEVDRVLRAVVAEGRAPLAFQVITRFDDLAIVAAEALLRGIGEDLEVVPPLELLAAADRCGLSNELGRLILQSACHEAARWQHLLPERHIGVAVNVSPEQFRSRELVDEVRLAIEGTGLEPSRLTLEVPEAVLMEDTSWSERQLALLKMTGVGLSADDYGTGHTSLSHLKRFRLDSIKVDLSLVAGLPDSPEDLAIVAATMGVADALGLLVIAEGVENERQLAELRRLGCGFGQGFLWSSAVPADQMLELVRAVPDAAVASSGPAGEDARERWPVTSSVRADGAEQLDAALRSLVHEVRTPLTVAMGYASLLEASVEDDGHATIAANIRKATERINHLLGNLEDVRLLDLGTLDLDATRLDLRALVATAAEDLASVVHPEIVVELGVDGPLEVEADELRIGQVLANLVTNAAKFARPGSPIRIRVTADEEWALVSVTDDGPGIAQEDLGIIYRKYGRADRSRQGSGLGLYLARGTARAHGGDVTYRRERPGSTFTLSLPRPATGSRRTST